MENKQLVIACVGNASLHKEWISGHKNFDLILIYYGGDDDIYQDYKNDAMICINQKGQKYPMIKQFIQLHADLISRYDYIWLPDDDVSISTENINKFFDITRQYNLRLSQPALINDPNIPIVHGVTKCVEGNKLRYTNFIEGMAPLFTYETLMFLCGDFEFSDSGWGLDVTWSHRLGDPIDKIAVIDETPMAHTRPTGSDYGRLGKTAESELISLLTKYGLTRSIVNLIKNHSFIEK